jgi:hypothetical protein
MVRRLAGGGKEIRTAGPSRERVGLIAILAELLGAAGEGTVVRPPFHCNYGYNIRLGRETFVNFGCVFLDVAAIELGDYCQVGPLVQIYTADHPRDPALRLQGYESSLLCSSCSPTSRRDGSISWSSARSTGSPARSPILPRLSRSSTPGAARPLCRSTEHACSPLSKGLGDASAKPMPGAAHRDCLAVEPDPHGAHLSMILFRREPF